VLDCQTEIYVWIGKAADKEIRNEIMIKAEEIKNKTEHAQWCEIIKASQVISFMVSRNLQ
jgi:hypothetical protein